MNRTGHQSNARARILMGGAVLAACLASPAFAVDVVAVDQIPAEATAPPAPTPEDGLGDQGYYLEADTLIQDDRNQTLTAEGGVQIRHQGRILRAEQVVYNRATGVVVAKGAVTIVERDGTMAFADEVVLDDQLRAGVAKGFSARLQ
ncbi:MAG TPA: LPS-assembly protein LptD, partial [Caulobacter sp.]|nr:LPS-assembly protein LptD [Caulobacter sp.]